MATPPSTAHPTNPAQIPPSFSHHSPATVRQPKAHPPTSSSASASPSPGTSVHEAPLISRALNSSVGLRCSWRAAASLPRCKWCGGARRRWCGGGACGEGVWGGRVCVWRACGEGVCVGRASGEGLCVWRACGEGLCGGLARRFACGGCAGRVCVEGLCESRGGMVLVVGWGRSCSRIGGPAGGGWIAPLARSRSCATWQHLRPASPASQPNSRLKGQQRSPPGCGPQGLRQSQWQQRQQPACREGGRLAVRRHAGRVKEG